MYGQTHGDCIHKKAPPFSLLLPIRSALHFLYVQSLCVCLCSKKRGQAISASCRLALLRTRKTHGDYTQKCALSLAKRKKEKNEKSGRKIKWEKLDHRLQTWLFRAITHQESSEDLPDSDGDHVGGQLEQEDVPEEERAGDLCSQLSHKVF